MQIKTMKVSEVIPYDKNPRKNDDAVAAVMESIKQCKYISPIIVDENNVVLAGHTRLKAIKKLGWKEVEVGVADGLTEEQKRKYRLLDNKTSEFAEWDDDLLKDELLGLDFGDFDFGFDFNVLETEEQEVHEDDYDAEPPEEPKAKRGQVYQLGNHRLMCGDSTSCKDVETLMNGHYADMVFTDPPYGVSANGGRTDTKRRLDMKDIENDDLRGEQLENFLSSFISAMKYKNGASIYICYPWSTQKEFTNAILKNDLTIKNCIIWKKNVFGLNGFKGYRPQYEMIYFCCKNDFEWYGGLDQSNVWEIKREIKREEQGNHPTPKPIELVAKAIKNSSKHDDIVADLFGGSGSTLIACEQTDRTCYMMEYDPKYIDVIIDRWEKFTGKKAVLIE